MEIASLSHFEERGTEGVRSMGLVLCNIYTNIQAKNIYHLTRKNQSFSDGTTSIGISAEINAISHLVCIQLNMVYTLRLNHFIHQIDDFSTG